jgi:hypothetical protein
MSSAAQPQNNEEFWFKLHLAIEGITDPLRQYVDAGKPIPDEIVAFPRLHRPTNRHQHEQWRRYMEAGKRPPAVRKMHMASLVAELLGERFQPQQPKHGRPDRVANEVSAIEQAERNAAWLVGFMLKDWRSHHGRKRVPGHVLTKMIREAAKEAARAFSVPLGAISERNIRNLLKSGRVVVH